MNKNKHILVILSAILIVSLFFSDCTEKETTTEKSER